MVFDPNSSNNIEYTQINGTVVDQGKSDTK
jgi:hypothetical protein